MKGSTSIFLTIIFFLFACKTTNKKAIATSNVNIRENTFINVIITNIDTSTNELYDFVKFYYRNSNKKGIILNKKSSYMKFKINQKIKTKLCDVNEWLTLYMKKDRNSIEPSVQILDISKHGETAYLGKTYLKDKDTLCGKGHAMPDRVEFNNGFFLDFTDSAIVPIFEICSE